MKFKTLIYRFRREIALLTVATVAACGGGTDASTSSNSTNSTNSVCKDGPTQYYTTAQIPLLTLTQVAALRDEDIVGMGANFKLLTNAAMASLQPNISQPNLACKARISQIEAITPDQIASLSPMQVRFLGSAIGGIAQLKWLSLDTFSRLVRDPEQVAALTVAEYATLYSPYFNSVGGNFLYLSDAVLASMQETYKANFSNFASHIASITPAQIESLTPQRVRLLGTADGSAPKIQFLTEATFRQAMTNRENVTLLTSVDASNLRDMHTPALGANIQYLSDDAMRSLKGTFISNPETKTSAVGGITPVQIILLSSRQVLLLASVNEGKGLASLAPLTFGALLPAQTAAFLPEHVASVRSEQLAKISTVAIEAMPLTTRRSFTALQKRELNAIQLALFV